MAKIVDLDHSWATEIGRVLIAFGSIEHVTVLCLRRLPRDNIFPATQGMLLGARLRLLLAVLDGRDDEQSKDLARLLGEAQQISEKRNLLVHNPLMLSVFQDADGNYSWEGAVRSLRHEDKSVSFPQVVALREAAERLASNLYGAAAPLLEPA